MTLVDKTIAGIIIFVVFFQLGMLIYPRLERVRLWAIYQWERKALRKP